MIDERIEVIGVPGKHDERALRGLVPAPERFSRFGNGAAVALERGLARPDGFADSSCTETGEGFENRLFDACGILQVQEGRSDADAREGLSNIEPERFGIAPDDRAGKSAVRFRKVSRL